MAEFLREYGTERRCERALEAARWPDGFCCPNCADTRSSFFEREGRGYHAFDFAKYALRYLAEVAYRFNRRFDLKSILRRLITATAQTRAYPLQQIRLAEVHCT